MTKAEWLKKAKKLRDVCEDKIAEKNGSVKCTTAEAKIMTELNHVIGSKHGIHQVVYKALKDSLDESIGWVEGGKKDEKFSAK